MGILDQLKGPVFQELMDVIRKQEGGLSGLVNKMKNSGLSEQVNSWVGKGENKPVEAHKLSSAVGSDVIQCIAAKLGITHEEAADKVAEAMPQVVDKLTPNGQVDEESENTLQKGWAFLKGMFN